MITLSEISNEKISCITNDRKETVIATNKALYYLNEEIIRLNYYADDITRMALHNQILTFISEDILYALNINNSQLFMVEEKINIFRFRCIGISNNYIVTADTKGDVQLYILDEEYKENKKENKKAQYKISSQNAIKISKKIKNIKFGYTEILSIKIIENTIYSISEGGTLVIYDIIKNKIKKQRFEKNLSSLLINENKILIGNKEGKIFIIENTKDKSKMNLSPTVISELSFFKNTFYCITEGFVTKFNLKGYKKIYGTLYAMPRYIFFYEGSIHCYSTSAGFMKLEDRKEDFYDELMQ